MYRSALLILLGLFVAGPYAWADDWGQWLGPRHDSVWRDRGVVERFPTNGLLIKWRVNVGPGYSAPSVAQGRVWVSEHVAAAPALADATRRPLENRGKVSGRERVQCLDEQTGQLLWQHNYECFYDFSYPSGPRTMPQVDGDQVFTLGADGHLRCLDVHTGRLIWSKHFPTDYESPTQTWGVASPPLIDGGRLFCLVGGSGHTVVALDRWDGRELWRALAAKEPGYSSPVLLEVGGQRQLIVWDTLGLNSINPESGEVYWNEPFPTKMGHAIGTPRFLNHRLLVSGFFDGSLMIQLDERTPKASVLWRIKGKDESHPEGLHSLMSTPFLEGDYIYGICGYGQLRCLKAATGERVWETLEPTTSDLKPARWTTAFLVKHEGRFFIWNEKGDLILARLLPSGYEEISRQHLLEPTSYAGGRPVVWSHPAFANGHVFVRNDEEIIRVSLLARADLLVPRVETK